MTAAAVQAAPETPKQAYGSTTSLPTLTSSDETQTDAHPGTPKSEFKAPKEALPEEERAGVVRQSSSTTDDTSPTVAALLADPPCGTVPAWVANRAVTQGQQVAYNRTVWQALISFAGYLNDVPPPQNYPGTYWQQVGSCPPPPAPTVSSMTPANGALVLEEQPTLQVQGSTWAGGAIDFDIDLCETPGLSTCTRYESCCSLSTSWQVPAGTLSWGKQYWWRAQVTDASTIGGASSYSLIQTFTLGVRQPTISSQLSTSGVNGQEFNQRAGNYTTTVTDVQVPVAGPPLSVVRSYNSMDTRRTGVFGAGWSTRWDMRIVPETIRGRESLLVTYPDGREVRFADKKNGTFQPPPGMYATLSTQTGGGWRLMDKSSTSYLFDAQGRLTKITDSRGRSQDLAYGADGKLAKATATGGRSLTFTWAGAHITSVTTDPVDGKALTWTYTYDGDVLTQVCNPAQECTTYGHDPGSLYRSTVLDSDPYAYWRLGEATGNSKDLGWGDAGDATYDTAAKRAQPGALAGTTDGAVELTPTTGVRINNAIVPKIGKYATMEAWFKTSASGTVISLRTSSGATKEEVFGVGSDGKLRSSYQPTTTPITTAGPVNDGNWHHAVLTVADNLQTLYLDGAVVGTLTQTIIGTENRYVTTIGGLAGLVDEVAIYDRPLTAHEVQRHHAARAAAPHKLAKITLPSGRVWAANVYEPTTDRLKSHTDRHGGTWQISDQVINRSTGHATVDVTDPNGGKITNVYDSWRGYRPISSTDQVQNTKTSGQKPTTYSYDTGGYLSKITDPNGNTLQATNDKRGNLLTRTTCRASGNCQTVHAEYYVNSNDQFDPRNDRVTKVRDARSASATDNTYLTIYEYNSYGEQTKQIAPATLDFPSGRTAEITYTDGTEPAIGGGTIPAGLVETRIDAKRNTTAFRYTAAGDLAEQTDPGGLITKREHDALGRLISRTQISDAHPGGVKTTFAYDGAGRLATQTSPGVKNEIIDVTHTAQTSYAYDPDGNTLTATVKDLTGGEAERQTVYTYDAYGHEETVTDPEGGVVRTSWNKLGRPSTVTDQMGAVFGYAYTERGQLAARTLKNWTGSPVNPQPATELTLESYSYDDGGRLSGQVDAMRRLTSYKYFGDNLLSQVIGDDVKLNGAMTTKDVVLEANTYDAAGNVTKRVIGADPISGAGITTTEYAYDAANRLTSETFDPAPQGTPNPAKLARKTAYTYDANNNVTATKRSAAGTTRVETTEHAYNNENYLTATTVKNDGQDLTQTWLVDDRGLVESMVDPRGNASGADPDAYTTSYRYDTLGRLVERKSPTVQIEKNGTAQPGRPTTRFGYNTTGQQTHTIDAEGRQTTSGYDRAGQLTSVTGATYTPPGGSAVTPKVSYAYDAAGRLIKTTDPRGHATTVEYDALGNAVRVTDPPAAPGQPAGQWVSEYNELGEELAGIDPTGARTQATYDDLGRQITRTTLERKPTVAAYTTHLEYNDAGDLTKVTVPGPGTKTLTTSYTVNAAGEVTAETNPAGNVTTYGYDLAGRAATTKDAENNVTAAEYDLAGRLIGLKSLDSAGATVRTVGYGYDAADNLTQITSGEGHITRRTFDASNLLTQLIEPVSTGEQITTSFGYDATGARTRFTDGRGNATWTSYNTLGLVETLTEPATTAHPDPADRTWTHLYDAAGNESALIKPGGVRLDRHYDALNRLTKVSGSGAGIVAGDKTYGYDLADRATSVGDQTLEYNDRSLLTKLTAPTGGSSFSYDALGNPTQRVDATGTTTFTWDDANRLKTVTDPVSGRTNTYDYDKADRLKTVTSANPANTQAYTYDALDRVKTHTLNNSSGSQLAKITYGWDKDDNLTSKATEGLAGAGSNTYDYDDAGRLTSWTGPDGTTTAYEWDAAGNRTKAGDKTSTYDERNRLLQGDGSTYTYTSRGTLATQSKDGASRTLTFDAFDRLLNDRDATYTYDVFDRLLTRQKTGGPQQRFVYAGLGNDIAAITDQAGLVQSSYGRDPFGDLVSVKDGAAPAAGALTDQHQDLIGTFTGTTLTASTAYTPFGETAAQTGTKTSLGYQTEYTDPDTGTVNMHARWYQPGTGTFTSRDDWTLPASPSVQANRYTYGNATPLVYRDPTGHMPDAGCLNKGSGGNSARDKVSNPGVTGGGKNCNPDNGARDLSGGRPTTADSTPRSEPRNPTGNNPKQPTGNNKQPKPKQPEPKRPEPKKRPEPEPYKPPPGFKPVTPNPGGHKPGPLDLLDRLKPPSTVGGPIELGDAAIAPTGPTGAGAPIGVVPATGTPGSGTPVTPVDLPSGGGTGTPSLIEPPPAQPLPDGEWYDWLHGFLMGANDAGAFDDMCARTTDSPAEYDKCWNDTHPGNDNQAYRSAYDAWNGPSDYNAGMPILPGGPVGKGPRGVRPPRLSDPWPQGLPRPVVKAYEDIRAGHGRPRIDPNTNRQKIFEGDDGHTKKWAGAKEWEVPGAKNPGETRILEKTLPDGRTVMGWSQDHYKTIHEFSAPHFPDAGW
ncbi:RHS repeat-associated core domain-containing protein [Nonomuraea sp. NPDC050202]|uniref:RHS repeat-associated core domain-containing protein n=1 Tax=Nonomuraea sp. NPDC050202 TaxID=3155035 RepID=UPI0033FEB00B